MPTSPRQQAVQRTARGTYVGPEPRLQGQVALLRPGAEDQWLAQFDDVKLTLGGVLLGYGWHAFGVEDFEIIPNPFDKGD